MDGLINPELGEMSPEELAKMIFAQKPSDPCSKQILPSSPENGQMDNDMVTFCFEILLTVYLEGLMYILEMIKNNTYDMETTDKKDYEMDYEVYKTVTHDDLRFPDPWFKSFGYSINVEEVDISSKNLQREYNNKIKPNSYCRTMLSFDPNDRLQFVLKGIQNKYHFILNGTYKQTNKIESVYTLLSKDNKIYKISFKQFKLN
ncbi:MAG: hypothetical protein Terrestrivirus3_30 [Terrestrivirus sp.]|uniref:Uncharacterized protein n=1 Tax=Terrestrivirus sp. TaxID=2487775 RepID=A0A3G4ZP77_9VIRU|nr:MAG: hypothetical protein Terrestrivirus3_30 [Terrestrivirus sp.]